jgi:hypothetical protein
VRQENIMLTIKAHFDGKTIVPDEPVSLPQGTALTIHVEPTAAIDEGGGERFATIGELLKSGAIGGWAHRTDITDSVAYARELRERAQRRDLE